MITTTAMADEEVRRWQVLSVLTHHRDRCRSGRDGGGLERGRLRDAYLRRLQRENLRRRQGRAEVLTRNLPYEMVAGC